MAGHRALWAVQSAPKGWKRWAVPEQVVSAVGIARRGNELSCTPTPAGTLGAHQHQVFPVWAQADIFAG